MESAASVCHVAARGFNMLWKRPKTNGLYQVPFINPTTKPRVTSRFRVCLPQVSSNEPQHFKCVLPSTTTNTSLMANISRDMEYYSHICKWCKKIAYKWKQQKRHVKMVWIYFRFSIQQKQISTIPRNVGAKQSTTRSTIAKWDDNLSCLASILCTC